MSKNSLVSVAGNKDLGKRVSGDIFPKTLFWLVSGLILTPFYLSHWGWDVWHISFTTLMTAAVCFGLPLTHMVLRYENLRSAIGLKINMPKQPTKSEAKQADILWKICKSSILTPGLNSKCNPVIVKVNGYHRDQSTNYAITKTWKGIYVNELTPMHKLWDDNMKAISPDYYPRGRY